MKSNKDLTLKNELIEKLIVRLDRAEHVLRAKKATTGFDGFVDTIVRIIRNKKEGKSPSLFRTKKQFGNYIVEKEGTSFSLELEERSARIGGNMPILSNALGNLGVQVNCIGSLGHPKIHPIFRKLSSRCHVYSFAEPGHSTAFEFEDGKILLAQMGELNHLRWSDVVDLLGLDRIISLFQESGLICMVNWSEISMSTDIWKGILRQVMPRSFNHGTKQTTFFDLSDCSKQSEESIMEVLNLIKEFSNYSKVILGLNRNESNRVYEVLMEKKPKKDLQHNGEKIFGRLGIATLVLHSSKEAIAFEGKEKFESCSFYIEQPTILTGAGDNFNGGFCTGQLLELDPALSLLLAHAVSGLYIQTGKSPHLYDVVRFLRENQIDQKK